MKDLEMTETEINEIKSLFRQANAGLSGPSPYLKTRVLAQLREKQSRSHLFRWKSLATLSAVFSLGLIAVLFYITKPDFTAQQGQPVLVKVELEPIQEQQIAFAEIQLPEGVHFYSAQFPEMNSKNSLVLEWNPAFMKGKLPFVVKSEVSGGQEIKIILKNANQAVIGEKTLQIQFKG